jgi:hypothetical protein
VDAVFIALNYSATPVEIAWHLGADGIRTPRSQ